MSNNRRSFIKRTAVLAGALTTGGITAGANMIRKQPGRPIALRDAGMQMCEAYFDGFNEHKIALCKQLNVMETVGGINPKMFGLDNTNPWDYEVITAVKNAWANEGLTRRVIEPHPALEKKTKLGLDGRDEEISHFITLLKNLAKAGIDTLCYNWMPMIGWFRTGSAKRGRGGVQRSDKTRPCSHNG